MKFAPALLAAVLGLARMGTSHA
jgi:hypothetical protein